MIFKLYSFVLKKYYINLDGTQKVGPIPGPVGLQD